MDRYGYGDGKPGNPSVGYVATTQLKDIKQAPAPARRSCVDSGEIAYDLGLCRGEDVIPEANIRRLADLLWEFQEIDPIPRRAGTSRSCATTR